jgi:hypothetical protein
MLNWLKSCTAAFIMLAIILVTLVVFLELGSNWYIQSHPTSEAPPILVCHLDYYPVDQKKTESLAELLDKYKKGEKISTRELDQVALLASQGDMPGLNGIVCNGMIIVSDRLVGSARIYVIRHELEHIFQMEGLETDCQDDELCATWAAARVYPVGFIAAVISSLIEAYQETSSIWEFLFSSWYLFKIYLLPVF